MVRFEKQDRSPAFSLLALKCDSVHFARKLGVSTLRPSAFACQRSSFLFLLSLFCNHKAAGSIPAPTSQGRLAQRESKGLTSPRRRFDSSIVHLRVRSSIGQSGRLLTGRLGFELSRTRIHSRTRSSGEKRFPKPCAAVRILPGSSGIARTAGAIRGTQRHHGKTVHARLRGGPCPLGRESSTLSETIELWPFRFSSPLS